MESDIPVYIVLSIFVLTGSISLGAAIGDWQWFFNSRNCRTITRSMTRRQARWLYGCIGVAIWAMAIAIFFDFRINGIPRIP